MELLSGVEAIRRRPGMYVGDVRSGWGMRQLLWKLVDNAIDEHRAGRASTVRVTIEGWTVTVEDDGRGIPVDIVHPPFGEPRSCLEEVFTQVYVGRRPRAHASQDPESARCGSGGAIVSALSRRLEVEVTRDEKRYRQVYEQGRPTTPLLELGPTDRVGTWLSFVPDLDIFEPTPWDRVLIGERLWEHACLNPDLTFVCNETVVRASNGLEDYVRHGPGLRPSGRPMDEELLHDCLLHVRGTHDGVDVQIVLGWCDGPGWLRGFANCYRTDRGTHIDGLRAGLASALASSLHREAVLELVEPGLRAAVRVDLSDPHYANATRAQLDSPAAAKAVATMLEPALGAMVATDPSLHALIDRRLGAARL